MSLRLAHKTSSSSLTFTLKRRSTYQDLCVRSSSPSSSPSPSSSSSSKSKHKHKQALDWLKLGLYDKASTILDVALDDDTNNARLMCTRARVHHRMRQISQARQLYEQAASLDASSVVPLHAWACMESDLGNAKDALALFERALLVDSAHAPSHQAMGRVYAFVVEPSQPPEAVACFALALKHNPKHAPTLHAWAQMLERRAESHAKDSKQMWDAARRMYSRAIEVGGDKPHAPSVHALGRLLERRGKHAKAMAMYENRLALSQSERSDAPLLATYAQRLLVPRSSQSASSSRSIAGLDVLKRAALRDPTRAVIWLTWSRHEDRCGRPRAAVALLRRGASCESSPGRVSHALAAALLRLGTLEATDEARELLERLASSGNDAARAHACHTLGRLAWDEGMLDAARAHFRSGAMSSNQPVQVRALASDASWRVANVISVANDLSASADASSPSSSSSSSSLYPPQPPGIAARILCLHDLGDLERFVGSLREADAAYMLGDALATWGGAMPPSSAEAWLNMAATSTDIGGSVARPPPPSNRVSNAASRVLRSWALLGRRESASPAKVRIRFRRAALLDPGDANGHLAWALYERSTGRRAAARACFRRGAHASSFEEKDVELHARVLQAWASTERRAGAVEDARRLYNEAIKVLPSALCGALYVELAQLEMESSFEDGVEKAREVLRAGVRSMKAGGAAEDEVSQVLRFLRGL